MVLNRRQFVGSMTGGFTAVAMAGLAAKGALAKSGVQKLAKGYGPLIADPSGIIDLPKGFTYRVISQFGDRMDDGYIVPDRADGMGAFAMPDGNIALVRNHELKPKHDETGPFADKKAPEEIYDYRTEKNRPLPGGTTTLLVDPTGQKLLRQHLSLAGTIRNCAGGTTPWGSWLSCEEDVSRAGSDVDRDHGYIFEVSAANPALSKPEPLKAMGRFNHEAAAVDPRTGIVYLTEDRSDSLFYRFIPNVSGQLAQGGKLQALAFQHKSHSRETDNRNAATFAPGSWRSTAWIDLDNPESPDDDLRMRGYSAGAARFARGEGITYGDGEMYFTCTSGGAAGEGQIMRYRPSLYEGDSREQRSPGHLQLFFESMEHDTYSYGDNLTVAPSGDLIVCEDQYTAVVDNHLRGVTATGAVYDLAKIRLQTEPAGACFSPDGKVMFLNIYSPTKTLAITGPWHTASA